MFWEPKKRKLSREKPYKPLKKKRGIKQTGGVWVLKKDGMDRRTFIKINGGPCINTFFGKIFKGQKLKKAPKVPKNFQNPLNLQHFF
ncbi:MAG: hypothetical protein CM15mV55_100 [uncultured marine virus]|nr:MAG: hypothetical protein CM15mV55_100 [uncultured marine virus]